MKNLKTIQKNKLALNKMTISNLASHHMMEVKGGIVKVIYLVQTDTMLQCSQSACEGCTTKPENTCKPETMFRCMGAVNTAK